MEKRDIHRRCAFVRDRQRQTTRTALVGVNAQALHFIGYTEIRKYEGNGEGTESGEYRRYIQSIEQSKNQSKNENRSKSTKASQRRQSILQTANKLVQPLPGLLYEERQYTASTEGNESIWAPKMMDGKDEIENEANMPCCFSTSITSDIFFSNFCTAIWLSCLGRAAAQACVSSMT